MKPRIEFFGSADLDRDGRTDLVIVDKATGKYRIGYQLTPGVFSWVDCRPSGIKDVTGFGIGRLLTNNQPAAGLHLARRHPAHDSRGCQPHRAWQALVVPFTDALGPNFVMPVDIGGAGKTPSPTFTSVPSSTPRPEPGHLAAQWRDRIPQDWRSPPGRHRRAGQPPVPQSRPTRAPLLLVQGDKGATLNARRPQQRQARDVAAATDLPAGSDYAVGNFGGSPLRNSLFTSRATTLSPCARRGSRSPGSSSSAKARALTLGSRCGA